MNPEEKEKLVSGRAEWYITLDPADKDKVISQVQANKEAYRNSVQHYLAHEITAFQSKIREGPYYICSVCNRILYRKTVIQLKKQMCNTQQELFTELYTHESFPSWNDLSPIVWWQPFLKWVYALGQTLSSLFQYISPTPLVSLQLIPRIWSHPVIPVTLLTGSSFILFGICKTRYYIIEKQDRSRCFNDQKLVIFFQPLNNLYHVTCYMCLHWWLLCIQWSRVFIVNVWDYAKIKLTCIRSMSNITYPGRLTYKLLTRMMKIWSLIKYRVLSPNVQVGYNALTHSLCSPRRAQICSKITPH